MFNHYVSELGELGVSEFAMMFNVGMMIAGIFFIPFMFGLGLYIYAGEDLPEIKLDTFRLAQVVGNLVSNAIRYTPNGGSVRISAGQSIEKIWIKVTDSGPGVLKEEQELIFQPFYRGTHGQRIKQGMWLGLSIARDLTNAHDGQLEVESTPGEGASFTIWLPKT